MNCKKLLFPLSFLFSGLLLHTELTAQENNRFSAFDPRHWGVVLQHPDMNKVTVEKDIVYNSFGTDQLHIDIYSLPGIAKNENLPAIIFLNGIGERAGDAKVKSWEIYSSWPRLMAAYGYIGISMETDGNQVPASFDALFTFLKEKGKDYHIDADRLGVYAASANTTESGKYLMKTDIHSGIKAAVLYYGNMPQGPLRKDLPVYFVIAEGDVRGNSYRNIWEEIWNSRAPWTVRMGTDLPHGFDAFTDNDKARTLIKETISFWQNNLNPVPHPTWKKSVEREIVETGYWHDDEKLLRQVNEWMKNNPDSKDAAVLEIYSGALFNTGKYAEAEPLIKDMAARDTSNKFIHSQLSIIAYKLGRKQEAESYYNSFIKDLEPKRNFIVRFASQLYQAKLYNEAGIYYEKANTIEERPVDFYNQACCYALGNNLDKAFESLHKAINRGFIDKRQYENDTDLVQLKNDPRWNDILKKLN